MKHFALVSICLIMASLSYGQTRVVRGKLTTFNRYPVMNVEVSSKKANSTVTTDSLGEFQLVCSEKDVILIKTKVFQQLSKKISKNDEYVQANLIFKDSPKNRDIATGMNYIAPEQLTFALAHLNYENNDFCNYSDIFSLIRGKFPGVTIKSGANGQGIYVRGQKSLYGDTEAMYVIDGMQTNELSYLNPCDLATIDILKDGGAAIYGARAANGVVVIETKGYKKQQSADGE